MPPEAENEQVDVPALDADTIAAIKKLAGQTLEKAGTDPAKIVAAIQAARNELELSGDMEGAALYTQAIALVQQAAGEAETAEAETPEEPPAEEAVAEGELLAAAKPGNLRKAGRPISGARLASLEQTVKTLLQMMAGAGSAKAQKAISAMADGDEMAMSAKSIGDELAKAMTPLAQALLNVNDRLIKIEAQPAPGGPVLRPVPKTIAGQKAAEVVKPAMPGIVKAQLDDLLRKSHTDANPTLRLEYKRRYDELAAQYQ